MAAVLLLAGAVYGTVAFAAAAFTVVVLLAVTWVRLRGRWAFEWLSIAIRYAGRRRTAAIDAAPTAVLEFAVPGARVVGADLAIDRTGDQAGDQAAVISDGHGFTAVLELGDPTGLLAEEQYVLPSPAALLPAGADHPPCRIQLLLTGVPAPAVRTGNSTPANSYRQLTEGRLRGHSRVLLAVRVGYAEGWSGADLRRSLSGLVRKIPRRLRGVPVRPLGEVAALRAIAELARGDGPGIAAETWAGLRVGNTIQATYRLQRWPDLRVETSRRIVDRILSVPAAAITVAVTAEVPDAAATTVVPSPGRDAARASSSTGVGAATAMPSTPGYAPPPDSAPDSAVAEVHRVTASRSGARADVTIRLVAPDPVQLSTASLALRKVLAAEHAQARRLDGAHLDGLAATLPLGVASNAEMPAGALDGLELTVGAAGLMIGRNRTGDPVVARLFRPEPTRALLVGGVRCAQLLTLRAMALGARVVVQTARPQAWEPFARGAAVTGESITVVPPARAVEIPAGSALRPLLVVVDIGPVGADTRAGPGWHATVVVRDDFSAADVDVASRADLLVLQPLRADEAELVGAAIGLGETAAWLTRIRADMVGLVNRRAVRWAALAQTPIEAQLIGPAGRG
ncbi:MAG TPA: type VII secretion protein EccE [Actinoplanes sp.]|nr:type VII secretion protein EccE [Actinoplanes sp.]